ncbi:phage terminase large subunit [Bradyrhizobium sp. SZCCHNR3015]|uniref:phage terminase large subunit n=1 Tax=Bradyrhizobium sp. SZCCHNR3015 TaxID=3057395 RepID=UPI0029161544|nr:phage terminase large subunit [Bradyrhizobium sp. SZCCHNR3015]
MTPDSFSLTPRQQIATRLLGGVARNVLMFGGARSGKTFLICRAILARAIGAPGSRHAILRFRANAARSSISLDTLPKARSLCFPSVRMHERRQDGFWELPNGSQIWVAGLDDKERVEKILGQEFATLFFNECSQIPYTSVLLARTRLAQRVMTLQGRELRQKAFYDLNPAGAGHWTNVEFGLHKDPTSRLALGKPEDFVRMGLNPTDNAANLTPEFIASLDALPEKQRRRFYEGIYVAEVEGALWSYERLDQCRIPESDVVELKRIVVSVDPSGARGPEDKRSDEIGIIVAGLGVDGRVYVLEDLSLRDSPAVWARRAVHAFYKWRADAIIGETNFGGAMVAEAIRTVDENVPFIEVTASRGKWVRAEPVSGLYDPKVDKVRHVGRMPDLEEQMTMFSQAGYTGERSPDRADALVWAVHELLLKEFGPGEAFLELARREMADKARVAAAAAAAGIPFHDDTPEPIKKEWAKGSVEWMRQQMGEDVPPPP